MNRAIVIPAGLCAVALAALLATIRGETRRSTAFSATLPPTVQSTDSDTTSSLRAIPESGASSSYQTPVLSHEEAQQQLSALVDQYLRPWREWENSPQRVYSRAAPRPIPSISAEIAIVPTAQVQGENLLLGTITVKAGIRSERIPCVVDRISKAVWLSASGQWLTGRQWLTKAPVP
jgi:hypothetical protein